jgi:hypothetical protein
MLSKKRADTCVLKRLYDGRYSNLLVYIRTVEVQATNSL